MMTNNGKSKKKPAPVTAAITTRNIPTYGLGKPEINPVFFEKRVYQGSNGKVYPVPFIDKVFDHKMDVVYQLAQLENEFVKLELLPEIGGRIFQAQDKTNKNYDFFYRQDVIKPALVGLAGPWISGGVEFNWPQHHRPGTYLPTDVYIEEEADGATTIWMSEYDPINRLKGMHGIRLRPGSALIELRARLFNRTPLTQTFLWWANVAVQVHQNYESFFPRDVHYVADHAVRAMSSFPYAQNNYYGIPYHERSGQNDLRRYSNIPVPTSYMVCETNFDFFGGYDHDANGGFIHVANRHIAPGKKQWTWGNSEFGQAWDRELTDQGGPYFELMAGVYTDNQPDFSYLAPYETKTFSQFWWAFKKLGPVQNANKDLAIRLEIMPGNRLDLGLASSRPFDRLKLVLRLAEDHQDFDNISVTPDQPWQNQSVRIQSGEENNISIQVYDSAGIELLEFKRVEIKKDRNRAQAVEPNEASLVENPVDLKLIAEHLEQYRHPTRYPEAYWEEAIKRNPRDYQAQIAFGKKLLQQGRFEAAEVNFKSAIKTITAYHPNPASGEAHYFAGLVAVFSNHFEEAYTFLYKAGWDYAWKSASYFLLATIDCRRKDFDTALEHIERSLDTNRQNNKSFILKAVILRHQNKKREALQVLYELLKQDPLDQWARFELTNMTGNIQEFLQSSRNDAQTIIDMAFDYADAGFYTEAIGLIEIHHEQEIQPCAVPNPMQRSAMTWYILAWLHDQTGNRIKSEQVLSEASAKNPDYFFPSRLHEQMVLNWAIQHSVEKGLATYGLGNYLLDKKRHQVAIQAWELAAAEDMPYGTLYRNLGIAYWNSNRDGQQARAAFKKAIQLAPDDMRILFEYDQLRKKLNDQPKDRLSFLEPFTESILSRDDFTVELAALYNFVDNPQRALAMLQSKNFHPWEGGEGQVLRQYTEACLILGQQELRQGEPEKALNHFILSDDTPDNLGEKYHPLQAKAHINYWKGMAYKALGQVEEAQKHFIASTQEAGDFIDMAVSEHSEMSYYRALSHLELGEKTKALALLKELKAYAHNKLKQKVTIDYFATSLPLLLVFEDDLDVRNEWENKYLMALAELGLGNQAAAQLLAREVLQLNAMHGLRPKTYDLRPKLD